MENAPLDGFTAAAIATPADEEAACFTYGQRCAREIIRLSAATLPFLAPCPHCGKDPLASTPCSTCQGNGRVEEQLTLADIHRLHRHIDANAR